MFNLSKNVLVGGKSCTPTFAICIQILDVVMAFCIFCMTIQQFSMLNQRPINFSKKLFLFVSKCETLASNYTNKSRLTTWSSTLNKSISETSNGHLLIGPCTIDLGRRYKFANNIQFAKNSPPTSLLLEKAINPPPLISCVFSL